MNRVQQRFNNVRPSCFGCYQGTECFHNKIETAGYAGEPGPGYPRTCWMVEDCMIKTATQTKISDLKAKMQEMQEAQKKEYVVSFCSIIVKADTMSEAAKRANGMMRFGHAVIDTVMIKDQPKTETSEFLK